MSTVVAPFLGKAQSQATDLSLEGAKAPTPIEYVKALPVEDKEDIFLMLISELLEVHSGNGLIPIMTPDGKSLGHYVPPAAAKAQFERMLAEMPPHVREAMTRPVGQVSMDDCLSDDEVRAIIRGEHSKSQ